tara:strand:+ start:1314 stop:1604 length:291 start_codon:yes stop_codon:yes gene_type:complete
MDKKEKFKYKLHQAIENKRIKKEKKIPQSKIGINYSIAINITIELITGMALGFFLGIMLDNYLQTKPLMLIIFIILGIIVGFYNMYKTLKRYGYFN